MAQTVTIVSRQQWGAAPPKKVEKMGAAQRVIIHHTGLAKCKDQAECIRRLQSIQRQHMNERNFDDIGYNFLISGDGAVYEGRGWSVVGAHAKHNNHDSLGVAFMGNFNDDSPTEQAMSAAKQLLLFGKSKGFLVSDFELVGHKDVGSTECPGKNLYDALPQLKI